MTGCRARGFLLLAALGAAGGGCKKHPPAPVAAPPDSASATPAVKVAPRCAPARAGAVFTIGDPGKAAEADDDGGDEVALPFAVDVGSAVGYDGGFAVSALRSKGGATSAVVALVGADGDSGRIVDLGKAFGDVEPPRLVARGDDLIVALPGNDAGGGTLRLLSLHPSADKPGVKWGAEFEQGRDESQVFSVELGQKRGAMAWDEWDKGLKHSVVRVTSFAMDDVSNATRARTVSPKDDDAEAPRLTRRPGGFWLAWISHSAAGKDAADAATSVVDLGNRALEIVPLDDNASPTSSPVAVTSKSSHVLVFDLAPAADGGALLAWRDDEASPGVEGRIVRMARVAAGGSVDASVIDDDKVGAGVPSLIVDPAPPADNKVTAWLALAGVSDATRIAALGPDAHILDRLGTEPLLKRAEPLAMRAGRILLAEPRGLAMDLSVVTCKPGAPLPPDAGTDDAP